MHAENAQKDAQQHKNNTGLRLRRLIVINELGRRVRCWLRQRSWQRRRCNSCPRQRRRRWWWDGRGRQSRGRRRCSHCRRTQGCKTGAEWSAGRGRARSHLPRNHIAHHICSSNCHFCFICGSLRTSKHRAAAIFGETIGVMRSSAAWAVLVFALGISHFGSAIRADWVQFRCLSW